MIGKGERLFAWVFGLLLVGTGVYAWLFSQTDALWRFGGGAALVLLGGNLLQSAWQGKPSWLSRLGPLP